MCSFNGPQPVWVPLRAQSPHGTDRAPRRSSSSTRELAPAILLAVALPLGSFNSKAGGENPEREQRKEPAPAASAARLNCTGDELGVEPTRLPARRQPQLGTFNGAAPRPQRAKEREHRDHQEKAGKHRCRDQRLIAFGEPNERDQQDEYGGQRAERDREEAPYEQPGAQPASRLGRGCPR